MKKVFNTLSIAIFFTASLLFTSCKKDSPNTTPPSVQSLLTTKTWQVDEVTDYTASGTFREYKKGASNNASDFSLVRQKFNVNGTITYTDDSGVSGNDGQWQLLENNTKLKLGLPSMSLSVVCDEFAVTANTFSYKLYFSATEYTQFSFVPVP